MSGKDFVERINELFSQRISKPKSDFYQSCMIPKNSLSNWATRNTIPAADVAVRIAKYLSTTVEYLVCGEERESDFEINSETSQMSGEKIVERIDEILNSHNQKRQDVADFVGIRPNAITEWSRRNNTPAGNILYKIAKYLNVSLEWLISGESSEKLSNDDRDLLYRWHELDDEEQEEISMMINFKIRKKTREISQAI